MRASINQGTVFILKHICKQCRFLSKWICLFDHLQYFTFIAAWGSCQVWGGAGMKCAFVQPEFYGFVLSPLVYSSHVPFIFFLWIPLQWVFGMKIHLPLRCSFNTFLNILFYCQNYKAIKYKSCCTCKTAYFQISLTSHRSWQDQHFSWLYITKTAES